MRGDSREVFGVPDGRHGAAGVVLVERQPKPDAVVLTEQRRLARQRRSLWSSVQFREFESTVLKRNQALGSYRVSRQREGALKVGARPQEIVLVVFREDDASGIRGCRLVNSQQKAIEEGCASAGSTMQPAA